MFGKQVLLAAFVLVALAVPLGSGRPSAASAQAASLTGAWVVEGDPTRTAEIDQTGTALTLTITASPNATAVGRVYQGSFAGAEAVLRNPFRATDELVPEPPAEVRRQIVERGLASTAALSRLDDGRLRVVYTTFRMWWEGDTITKIEDNYGPVERIYVRVATP